MRHALELFRAAADLDAVYVGVGMGSGISGLITVRDLLGLKTDIISIGAAGAPAAALSFAARDRSILRRRRHFLPTAWRRDPKCGEPQGRGAHRRGHDEIAEAMRIYFSNTHQVAEGAGARPAGCAAAGARQDGERKRRRGVQQQRARAAPAVLAAQHRSPDPRR